MSVKPRVTEKVGGVSIFSVSLVLLLASVAACGDGVGPPATGELSISTVTTGPEPDTDGYLLTVDEGNSVRVDASGTALFGNLAEGTYAVQIADIATNCSVSGDNPRTVSIVASRTVSETFSVSCFSTRGGINVTTATTGEDPDGAYSVVIDGGIPIPVAGTGTVSITDVSVGTHLLQLADIAENCTVSGENPRSVSVTAGIMAAATFDVYCVPAVGDLVITTSAGGQDLDPDGYVILVDTEPSQAIGIDDTVVIPDLPVGPHQIELTGLAANCKVNGPNPLDVDVDFGIISAHAFEVSCTQLPLPPGRIVFHSDRDGDFEIYSVNADGSDVVQLTSNDSEDLFPSASPDGRRIAFSSDRDGSTDLYIMGADGSNVTQVTNSGAADRSPAWSPDGSRLAFSRGSADIYTIRIDGTDLVRLTDHPAQDVEPAWSPDGLKIAFTTDRDGADEIYTMNAADGSELNNLTNHPGRDDDADWSPDGSLILFHRNDSAVSGSWLGDGEIMCMAADGSNVIRMTTDTLGVIDWKPRWSPDGLWFVFPSDRDEGTAVYELYAARANACVSPPTDFIRVTDSPGKDEFADWSVP